MRKLILLIILFSTTFGYGQNTGLYGKKTLIEVSAAGYMPLAYNIFNDYYNYKNVNNQLVQKKDLFDYSFRVNLSRALKNNFALGFEYSMEFGNATVPERYYYDSWTWESQFIQHEQLSISTTSYMPKLIFASSGDLLPIGLSHQIGFGFTKTKIKDQDYLYETEGQITWVNYDTMMVDLSNVYKGYTFMYEMHINTPLTEAITLNYGIRYNLNYVPKYQNPNNSNIITESDLNRIISRKRIYSFMNFSIGLGYAF